MEEANEYTALTKSVEGVINKPSVSTGMMSPVPTPHPKTGLVHCVLERAVGRRGLSLNNNSNKIITLSLEGNDNNTPVLRAEAVSAHRFVITSATPSNNSHHHQTLATLVRLQSNLSTVTYGLRNSNDVAIAVVVYSVPSVSTFLKGPPPRRAQVALLNEDFLNTSKNDSQAWFEAACRDSIQQQGNLYCFAGNVKEVTLLDSKEPYLKSNGSIGLNFHGRGRQASPKNMQLTTSGSNDKTEITVQMAKWDTDQYILDYSSSVSLVTAFAFGLAQLDL